MKNNNNLNAVQIYKMILSGDINGFPRGFWKSENSKVYSSDIVRWLLEEKFEFNDDDIKREFNIKFITENGLNSMYTITFKNSLFEIIDNVYPGRFKPWELNRVTKHYWNLETSVEAIKWLVEDKLKLNNCDMINLKRSDFVNNKLSGMLNIMFNGYIKDAIKAAYPEGVITEPKKVYENHYNSGSKNYSSIEFYKLILSGTISRFPRGFWNNPYSKIECAKITRWLIEERLKMNDDDIRNKLNTNLIIKNKLGGVFYTLFNSSVFEFIDNAYPGKFKPWELKSTPNSFWNIETAKEATKWLIEDKLQWSNEDIENNINIQIFIDNNLGNMIRTFFNNSPYNAINSIYPERFKKEDMENYKNLIDDFDNTIKYKKRDSASIKIYKLILSKELTRFPKGFWDGELGISRAIEIVKWLIEDKLKMNDEDIKNKLTNKWLSEYHLGGMMEVLFNKSVYIMINIVYPGRFNPWELTSVPRNYWNKETAVKAIKWLIEDKLKLDNSELNKLTYNDFLRNGLSSIIDLVFNSSVTEAMYYYYNESTESNINKCEEIDCIENVEMIESVDESLLEESKPNKLTNLFSKFKNLFKK